ncbi:MAG: class I SAM-dependent methyltransferase [Gammaproteobacteria bacterium]|nr:class I SAM-dependent methyltransferase [Gammaproteobacteria bacterium]
MAWIPRKKRFNRCEPLHKIWPALQAWYRTPLGLALAHHERELVQTAVANLFGYFLVQIGWLDSADWLTSSRISQRVLIGFPGTEPEHHPISLIAEPHQLPLQSDSIDVVVLPHTLEFSHYPHEVLREVERVLIPEGHIVLLSFNPWSLWGARRYLPWKRLSPPWCARFLGTTRLKDWLALLGFEVLTSRGYCYHPPLQSEALLGRQGLWERVGQQVWPILGAANLLVARKRVTTLTPVRPRWAPSLVPAGLEPYQNRPRPRHG